MIIWHYIIKKSLITDKRLYFINVKNGEDEEFGAVYFVLQNQFLFLKKITIGIKEHKALLGILEV